jgi:hypothetical protein
MPEPFVRNAHTGLPPEEAMLRVLCNGDTSTKLARGGLDIRPYFEARVSHPVTFRIVNHSYQASMYRPTRREQFRGWWHTHYRALFWLLVPWVSVFLAIVALNLLLAGANALADWISAQWK